MSGRPTVVVGGNGDNAILGVVLIAAAMVGALGTASPVGAAFCDPPLNGTFTAAFPDCAGQVSSSQGWSAPMRCEAAGLWYVRRRLEHWEPCNDGTAAPAEQVYSFAPDLSGAPTFSAVATFSGRDKTVGLSGGCGLNKPLVIEIPFRLTQIG
jgi:hypothetical protein